MLNYIWAELYKVRSRKSFWILCGLLLALELLALLVMANSGDGEILFWSHPVGLFLVLPLSALVCTGLEKNGQMKNELSFGFTRETIYLAKLLSTLLLSLLLLSAVVLLYLGTEFLLGRGVLQDGTALPTTLLYLLPYLPVWVGGLSLVQMLFFLLPGTGSTATAYLGYLILGEGVLSLLFGNASPLFPSWLGERVRSLLLLYPFSDALYQGALPDCGLSLHSWLLGLGWTVVTTALGLKAFHRREC